MDEMVVKKFVHLDGFFFTVYNFNQITSSFQDFSKKVEKRIVQEGCASDDTEQEVSAFEYLFSSRFHV